MLASRDAEVRTACARAFGILAGLPGTATPWHPHHGWPTPGLMDGLRALLLNRQEWRKMRRRPDSGDEILLTARNA